MVRLHTHTTGQWYRVINIWGDAHRMPTELQLGGPAWSFEETVLQEQM